MSIEWVAYDGIVVVENDTAQHVIYGGAVLSGGQEEEVVGGSVVPISMLQHDHFRGGVRDAE